MDFAKKLDDLAQRLETRLGAHMAPPATGGVPAEHLEEAMAYGALDGGKRVRPFLLIESAALFGIEGERALDAACALECIHCYSLIHDDLPAMDDDAMRRGRPSVHVAFGEATAILAGDALLTLAFEIMAHPNTHPEPAIRAELALGLAQAAGRRGMAGGQSLDLSSEGTQLNADQITRIHRLKTGALIQFACEAGAVLGGADGPGREALTSYGAAVGEAFQLADDLLDVEGDAGRVGKATQKDAQAGKSSLVGALGHDGAHARLEALEAQAIAALEPFGRAGGLLAEAARFIVHRAH